MFTSVIDIDSMVDRFIPRGTTEFRARAWARFVVAVSFLTAPGWILFPIIGGLWIELPGWCAATLVGIGCAQLGIPPMLRATGSLFIGIMVFGGLVFVGITLSATILGGFPFHSLMWAMAIPIAVAAQREHRSLLPIWMITVVALYVGWYGLVTTGHAPAGDVSVDPSFEIWLHLASLSCWFATMLLISWKTSTVTYELADSRDVYQRALLQAQKLNALGKLAGSIENNFNNALMSIDYSLHLLSECLAPDTEHQVELDDMRQTVVRSKALSKKLERLGQGDSETIELVEVDVAMEALDRSLRRLTGTATLRVELNAPEAHILCDANQLDQVLVNLVINSRDAMPQGGEIVVSTKVVDHEVVIEVRDTGGGIDPAVLDHIFEPFYTTKGPDSGTGLGLWICHSIASGCGGTLTANSTVGRGTTMALRVPLANRHSPSTARPKAVTRPTELPSKGPARPTQVRGWSNTLDWFVHDIVDARLRMWGVVLVMIGFASVPIWWLFAALQWRAFGLVPITIVLLAGGVFSMIVPILIRVSRSPGLAMFAFAAIPFLGITAIAIISGGFRAEILIWTTLIPILGAQQREFRYFTLFWSLAVAAQIVVVFVLAKIDLTSPPLRPESVMVDEQLTILLCLLGLLAFGFRAASRVGAQLARERDDYATTLIKSQDFEVLGTLASSIAHDLNNILTTLEFGIELIRSELSATAPAASHLDELQVATAKIQDLSRQLTRFGRTNTQSNHAIPDTALEALAKMLGPIVGSHIKISMHLDSGASAIRLRSHELDQLIINLALNARDAMPEGGELHIATAVVDGVVEITVRDQGIGIPQPLLARIFEPFFTTSNDRVGLGLWVSREIVREVQGTVAVESTVGVGTTVRLIIPRALARSSDSMRRVRHGGVSGELAKPGASDLVVPASTSSTRIRRES